MTAPHDAFSFDDNVTYSDATETNFHSPAISISPPEGYGRRVSATNQAIAYSSSHVASADHQAHAAYASGNHSNLSLDHQNLLGQSNGVQNPSVQNHITNSPISGNPTNNPASASLNPASFASQPWISPSLPYLHFAPQPLYEPTGELINEHTDNFPEFDNPARGRSTSQSSSDSPENGHTESQTPKGISDLKPGSQDPRPVNAFIPPAPPRSALKRKADSLASPVSSDGKKNERPSQKNRSVSFERMSGRGPASPDETQATSDRAAAQTRGGPGSGQQNRRTRQLSTSTTPRPGPNPPSSTTPTESQAQRPTFRSSTRHPSGHPPSILPPEKVFPIQIGSELFRLSGASISSDAPSYFTQFFEEQIRQNEESGGVRTLYIDRDPETFRDVARHLQGYYVKPRDGSHFVKLFADAQFYSLPRLIDQLFESEIFIQIGERHFQIPKDIFSEPGNSPNFFSLGFAVFFSTPGEVFPGLDRRGLLRPPSITPPYVPGRSAEVFSELLHLLRGYQLHIRNEDHRAELLRDCRYFHLRGLEQKIIAHTIAYNLAREKHEITLRLEDVKPSGVSFTPDADAPEPAPTGGWVYYARPFVDEASYEVVIEIGSESTVLDLDEMRADFHNLTKARISSLFQVIANKMNLPTNAPLGWMVLSGGNGGGNGGTGSVASPGHTPLSEDRVKVRFDASTAITLDGKPYEIDPRSEQGRTMVHGPAAVSGGEDSDDEDSNDDDESAEDEEMSEEPSTGPAARKPQTTTTHRPGAGAAASHQRAQQQQQQQQQQRTAGQPKGARQPPVPPIQTTSVAASSISPSKKRKRPRSTPSGRAAATGATGTTSMQNDAAAACSTWLIRTAQWRLRVAPNPQDRIRGGLEIMFVGVKIEAFSGEKGRNLTRGFLGA